MITGTIKVLLTVLLITTSQYAYSQLGGPLNTVDLNTTYVPASGYLHSKDRTQGNLKTTQQTTNLGYSFLISSKSDSLSGKSSSWTGIISGGYSRLINKNDNNTLIPDKLLSSDLGVLYYHSINAKWSLVSFFSAGINSDLEKITSHDLFLNGAFLFIRTYSPHFSIGFGGAIYNAINMPILLPGILLKWDSPGKFKINVDLPSELSVAYDVSKKRELKLALRPKNIFYDVENNLDPKKTLLNYWELPVGLENKWKGKRWDFMLSAGVMTLRSFQFGERGIKSIYQSPPAHMMSANFFVNAGISYRIKK